MAIFNFVDLAMLIPSALLAMVFHVRYSLGTAPLEGLTQYMPAGNNVVASGTGLSKKKSKEAEKGAMGMGNAENLLTYKVTRQQVFSSVFHNLLDQLAIVALITSFTCVSYPVAAAVLGARFPALSAFLPTPVILAAGVAIMALTALARTDLISPYSTPNEKGYVILMSVVGAVAAAALFTLEPRGAFVWDADEGSAALRSVLARVAAKAAATAAAAGAGQDLPLDEAVAAMTPPPVAVRALLMVFATAISGLLLAPALRFVRAYRLQQDPPRWAETQLPKLRLASLRMQLLLLLPALTALTWARSLFDQPLGLGPSAGAAVRAGAATATGLAFFAATQPILQRYLDSAMITWYSVKHGAIKRSDRPAAAEAVIISAQIVQRWAVKAAVQTVAPGVFFLGCGLSLGTLVAHPAAAASPVAADTLRLINCLVGFAVWWGSIVWLVYCAGALWLYRTGSL